MKTLMMCMLLSIGCGAGDGVPETEDADCSWCVDPNISTHLPPPQLNDGGTYIEDAQVDVAIIPQEDSGCHQEHHQHCDDHSCHDDIN